MLLTVTEWLRWWVRRDKSMEHGCRPEAMGDPFVSLGMFREPFSICDESGVNLWLRGVFPGRARLFRQGA